MMRMFSCSVCMHKHCSYMHPISRASCLFLPICISFPIMMDTRSKARLRKYEEEHPFAIKKWRAVGLWSWNVVYSDKCAICKSLLVNKCLHCQDEMLGDCPAIWGECNHIFHNCCINHWVEKNSSKSCPICLREWNIFRICTWCILHGGSPNYRLLTVQNISFSPDSITLWPRCCSA